MCICSRMTRARPAGRREGWAAALLRACAPHVPAPAPAVRPPPGLQAALLQLNMAAAALLARFLPAAAAGAQQVRRGALRRGGLLALARVRHMWL